MRKFIGIAYSLLLFFLLTSCDSNNTTSSHSTCQDINITTYTFGENQKVVPIRTWCHSDSDEFPVDAVNITYYIGISKYVMRTFSEDAEFQISAKSLNEDIKIVMLSITEYDENTFDYVLNQIDETKYQIDYKYSVDMTIPMELFSEGEGRIAVEVAVGVTDEFGEFQFSIATGITIHYQLDNSVVTIIGLNE